MRWSDLRALHPNRWLVIEAVAAHTAEGRRELDEIVLVEACADAATAFQRYRALHAETPEREIYFVSTERAELEIVERMWTGIRWSDAPRPAT